MNQSIHFPERECWDENLRYLVFPALVNGITIDCYLSVETLRQSFGSSLSLQDLQKHFNVHRWDFEEKAEHLIRSERIDQLGHLTID